MNIFYNVGKPAISMSQVSTYKLPSAAVNARRSIYDWMDGAYNLVKQSSIALVQGTPWSLKVLEF